jgi:hypothetical protein
MRKIHLIFLNTLISHRVTLFCFRQWTYWKRNLQLIFQVMFSRGKEKTGKPEFDRKMKMSKDTNVDRDWSRVWSVSVWVRLIGKSNTDTQLIPTHIYLQPRTLALAPNHTNTQNPTVISIDIFFFDVFIFGIIPLNRKKVNPGER